MFLTLAVLCRNHRFSNAFQQDYLADPRNCPLQQPGLLKNEPEPEQLDLPAFFKQVLPTWKPAAGHPALLPPKHPSRHCLACFSHPSPHLPRYAGKCAPLSCAGVLQASLWLVVSAIASVLLGIAFLQLFKHQPHLMTKVTIASQVGLTLSCILWHLPAPLQ